MTISTTALAAVNGLIFLNYRGTTVVELFTEIWTHILHVFFAIRVCGWDSFSAFLDFEKISMFKTESDHVLKAQESPLTIS